MKTIYRQNQLITFLLYANGQGQEKTILDCGAGGNLPPLSLFSEHGYKTTGIDISEKAIQSAKEFERKNELKLNIKKGDMTNLEFGDESFGYVFSYNSVFHMSKSDIKTSISEMARVLKKGGLMFVNFASNNDMRATVGEKVGEGEYLQPEHGDMVLHSYHADDEPEKYFEELKLYVVYKESRVRIGHARNGGKVKLGYIDYIVEKK